MDWDILQKFQNARGMSFSLVAMAGRASNFQDFNEVPPNFIHALSRTPV